MRSPVIFFACLLMVPFGIKAQQVSVYSDSTHYTIGDYIRLEIEASAPKSTQIQFPNNTLFSSGFEVISAGPTDTLITDSLNSIRQEIILSQYDSGNYTIPAVPFVFTGSDRYADTLWSDSIVIRIETLEVDTTASIKPMKDIVAVSYRDLTWVYVTLVALLLAVLLILVYKWIQRHRKKELLQPVVVKMSLSAYTLQQLEHTVQQKLWQKDEIKLYYSALSDLVRMYLSKRFEFPALESTSDDIIDFIQGRAPQAADTVQRIFYLSDMVKFARSKPLPADHNHMVAWIQDFVNQTSPNPDPVIEIEST